MNEVVLVFFTMWIQDPLTARGPQFSENLFATHAECAEFVNTVADDGTNTTVVDENYEFEFATVDGLLFAGGCYTAQEYEEKYK